MPRPWCPGRPARHDGARRRRDAASRRRGPRGARGPPSAAGRSGSLRAGGSERLARFRPTSGTRGGRTCRPGGGGSASSCLRSTGAAATGRGRASGTAIALDPRVAVIGDQDLEAVDLWPQPPVGRPPGEEGPAATAWSFGLRLGSRSAARSAPPSRARAEVRAAELAHQGPDHLANTGCREVKINARLGRRKWPVLRCPLMAGFDPPTEGQGPRSAARRKRRARLAELRRARITGAVTLSRTTSERGGQEVLRRISANEPFSRGRRAVPKLAMRS